MAHSLLTEVPKNRSCAEAGIPIEFCSCNQMMEVDITSMNVLRAKDAFDEMLETILADVLDICANIRVERILKARQIMNTFIVALDVETKPKVGVVHLLKRSEMFCVALLSTERERERERARERERERERKNVSTIQVSFL